MKLPLTVCGSAALLLALAPPLPAQEAPAEDTAGAPAPAESETPSSLEVSASVGPSLVFGEPANPEFSESVSRIGLQLAGDIAYRSSYFVDPRLEVGYAWLASGRTELPNGPWGDGGTMKQQLGAWVISPGVSADIWRFRPRLGIGLSIISQSNDFHGESHSSSQVSLLTQLGLGFLVYEADSLRVDADARVVAIPGADITFISLAAVAHWDAIPFH